jgi:inosine-uridine nucleoside N-ribohydrolase
VFSASWKEIVIAPIDSASLVILTEEPYQSILHSETALGKALVENLQIFAKSVPMGAFRVQAKTQSTPLYDTVAIYLAFSDNHGKCILHV